MYQSDQHTVDKPISARLTNMFSCISAGWTNNFCCVNTLVATISVGLTVYCYRQIITMLLDSMYCHITEATVSLFLLIRFIAVFNSSVYNLYNFSALVLFVGIGNEH